ncbi:MAG: hypothetical protein GF353_00185, partial [Candidatus Lokiarchaeota archaeon]|nr:hypothetical protein [Candidatus Lokiarchaeota archaeon]
MAMSLTKRKRKRTAVVGAGWFGRAHIRNFYELSNLVAVCDKDEQKLDIVRQTYEGVNFYNDITDLLKNEEIDAVSIVTQPKNIPYIASPFAKAGIDILMEKPMALKLEYLKKFQNYDNIRIMPGFI